VDAAEFVVVGAGITGLTLACFLSRAGADVLVIDRAGIGAGASGVQPGGVRQQWSTEINCRLARESVEFYAHLDDELGYTVDAHLDRCGYLFVALSDDALRSMRENVELQNRCGVPSRMVTAAEAGELVPGLSTEAVTGGAWCAEDGYFDRPQTVVEAFAHAAAVRVAVSEVVALDRSADDWNVRTTNGDVRARTVVLAAGVHTRDLLHPLGVDVPIEPEPRHLFLSEPVAERLVDPLVVVGERGFAAKHLANGRVLASDLAAAGDAALHREQWRATVAAGIAEFLPALSYVSFRVLASGLYDVTPDHQPIVGRIEAQDGLWIAAGYSGHGFMLAPAISRRMADAMLEDGATPIREFAPDRFHGARLVRERGVV
jgi:sarcosine oxidase, subunit beta